LAAIELQVGSSRQQLLQQPAASVSNLHPYGSAGTSRASPAHRRYAEVASSAHQMIVMLFRPTSRSILVKPRKMKMPNHVTLTSAFIPFANNLPPETAF
jgi:hypothetical protein